MTFVYSNKRSRCSLVWYFSMAEKRVYWRLRGFDISIESREWKALKRASLERNTR